MSDEQIERAIHLYIRGASSIAIGRELGFDNHTVLKALSGRSIPIRGALGN